MKIIDKFLKYLNTDRNTFLTYILTLITIYLVVDRIVEILFMFFTGLSVSYWGPIQYTFALACPIAAFYLSGPSKFIKNDETKISFFYLYCIALYIIGISMLIQWFNYGGWLLLTFVPNYSFLAENFQDLIAVAFKSVSIYVLVLTVPTLFKFLYTNVNESKDLKDSILDYGGINLNTSKEGTGPYTCEVTLCKDANKGKDVKIPENRRFEVSLVVGGSGLGKTSMVFEPMMARDIEKKFFFRSVSKEMAFTALKSGVAVLNCPYTNEYINENFDMNMIAPNPYKETVYKAYMKNIIQDSSNGKYVYRNLGLTYLSPDIESTQHILDVASNYNMKVNLIDPNNPDSLGMNPFIYDDPTKTAIVISSVIRGMYKSIALDTDEVYKENAAMQAVENLSILLKEMYPRLSNGILPNLEDMLKMLNDFDLAEVMCRKMMEEPDLAEQYAVQIGYFKKHFFRNAPAREETERNVQLAVTQLDTLLRYPGVKNVLCNRNTNINFDEALATGQITLACTRRGDLGVTAHKAFGLFFILLMQHSVLSRPGNERSRMPHFFYVDEFSDFVGEATVPIFTLYRKYRVGSVISAQSLDQFDTEKAGEHYRKIILVNSPTKLVFGGNTPEDNEWWQNEFGQKRDWKYKVDYETDKQEYGSKLSGIEYGWTPYANKGKIQTLKFKSCIYKTKNVAGGNVVGVGKVDFLESKYKEKQTEKIYRFDRFNKSVSSSSDDENKKKLKFNFGNVNFEDENGEIDPVQMNTTDGGAWFNNSDALSFNFKKKEEQ